jgi:hypothetical protein
MLILIQKTVIVQNIDVQIARFKIDGRPIRSAFDIFIESAKKTDKKNIPPGMHTRLIICYKCDGLSEPEETLIIHVQNGKSVFVKIRSVRDPPILRGIIILFYVLTNYYIKLSILH